MEKACRDLQQAAQLELQENEMKVKMLKIHAK
jgi:hypothetical protein